ncbi:MAG TPA: 5-formyltetrahydrofolate cyclo-ligase [Candidatus Eisenbacteria bacterium]|nr:5-formyltetrahydrofolate cyclo-ligase [Candidatus Eisenbacteria bacterium]
MNIGEKKSALRAASLSQRNSLSEVQARAKSAAIQTNALAFPGYVSATSVALYSSVDNEVATEKILDHALAHGKSLFFPRWQDGDRLELVAVTSASELAPGKFGIPEPVGAAGLGDLGAEALLVFVPGLAFDPCGNRLGRGRGCYDRLLARLGPGSIPVGLAYEFQIVPKIPSETWDRPVRYVITESRIIDCADIRSSSERLC